MALVFCGVAGLDAEVFGYVGVVVLEFGEESFVAEVEKFGIFPVVAKGVSDALDNVGVLDLDSELATAIEAAGGEVDGADDGAAVIGEEQLGVKFNLAEFVDLNAEVLEHAKTADAFDEFFFFELVRRAGHDEDLDASLVGTHKMLDDGGVLIALVLEP